MIQALTDKNCPLGHQAALGRAGSSQNKLKTLPSETRSRLHVPGPVMGEGSKEKKKARTLNVERFHKQEQCRARGKARRNGTPVCPSGLFLLQRNWKLGNSKSFGGAYLLADYRKARPVCSGKASPAPFPPSSPALAFTLYSFICLRGTKEVCQTKGQKNKRRNGRDCFWTRMSLKG